MRWRWMRRRLEDAVRFGLMLSVASTTTPDQAPALYREGLAQVELAEELGYDCVWVAEHHFTTYIMLPAPLLFLTAAAQRTRTIRLGTAVLPLPFYHPLRLAEDVAMADILSEGRLTIGIGRGYQPYEFAPLGTQFEESVDRFEEILDILKLAWKAEEFSYHGRYYQVEPLTVVPRPLQQPHPPIWLASSNPRSITIAAKRWFMPLSTAGIHDPRELMAAREAYHAALREMGRDPTSAPLATQRIVYVAPTHEEAREAEEGAIWAYRASVRYSRPTTPPPDSVADGGPVEGEPPREDLVGRMIAGTPDEVAEKVERLRQLSITSLICLMDAPGLDPRLVRRSMRLFAEQVAPRFAGEASPLREAATARAG
jgi:alkanesulfonate monooxygenase SsuD/methylene tetrahydromethanopterin reductase-like flavin-dependent oxidoreductase (luciferase family)